MKPIKPVYALILIIVIAAIAFWGGMTYEKSKAASLAGGAAGVSFAGRGFGGGQGGYGGGAGAGGNAQRMTPVNGQIVSSGNNSITVKLSDGSSKIIDLTSQTMINKTSKGSTSDLTSGQQVTAIGSTNSDGSITAQDVNIGNGMFHVRTGGQGGGQPPSGSSGQ